jgi:membrane fusion protein (multidrug efflux system)
MAQPFAYTLRSLEGDSGRAVAVVLSFLMIAAVSWSLWMFRARVTVYEVSQKTRLEVRGATFPVHSAVAGRIAAVLVKQGQQVEKGVLMFRLDAAVEERRLATAQARLAAIEPQVEGILSELQATRGAVAAEVAVSGSAAQQAQARSRELQIQAELAASEAVRYRRLGQAASQIDAERISATAQMRQQSVAAATSDVRRLRDEQRLRRRSGEVKLAALRRQLATLDGEKQALVATVAELVELIERHQVRAPGDGAVGELLPLRAGSYVAEGAKLATLLPAGPMVLLAEFDPATALGRIRPQQSAELRLSGFPWLQFGVVRARVSQVASEVRDGTLRVELELLPDPKSPIPFQHGLPGSVDIAVEEVSPAELVLRSLGRRIEAPAGSSPAISGHS